jgi:hypothetical protein
LALATTTGGRLVAKLGGTTSRCLIVDDSARFVAGFLAKSELSGRAVRALL